MAAHDMSLAMVPCTNCRHTYPDTALFCPNCGTAKVRTEGDGLLGKVLGERFLVQARLGQGTSGTIYRAEHVTLRRKVAIKVLHAELARDDLAVERFRREATMVAEVDNEHIVEIHDFGRTPDGRLYLAMELLEGETLDAALKREGKLSVERTADILIQLGEALMEAHAVGYIHRDLRPRNIYLAVRRGKPNFVKLLDFGLSKLVESDSHAASTSLGMTFGDPHYMSPEQARGDRIDRRADIYQLGCIAYEMLTGDPPFTGKRVFDVLSRQVTEAPLPLPSKRAGVPLWMEAAVARMLAKSPDDRFATTSRLIEALKLGVERGEVMEAEVARQRETIPPPSVSRVMEKLGVSEEPSGRAGTIATAVAPPPSTTISAPIAPPPVAGGAVPAPVRAATPATSRPAISSASPSPSSSPSPMTGTSPELMRKRTGTPRVGVPVAPVAAAVAASPVAAAVVPAGTPPATPAISAEPPAVAPPIVPSAPILPVAAAPVTAPVTAPAPAPSASASPNASASGSSAAASDSAARSAGDSLGGPGDPGVSQVWFEDDDPAISAVSLASRGARKKRSSNTSLLASSTDVFYQQHARRKRRLLVGGIGVAVLAAGGLALAFMGGGGEAPTSPEPEPSAVAPVPVEPVAPAPVPVPPPAPTLAAKLAGETTRPSSRTSAPSSRPASERVDATPARPVAPGEDPLLRRPGGGTAASAPPTRPPEPGKPVVEPPVSTPPGGSGGSAGVSGGDGTLDPYGGGAPPSTTPAPSESEVPESVKQAEDLATAGQQAMARGDIAGAASSFKKATELDAKNLVAIAGLGEIALQQGLFGDAIAHLRKASRLAPRSARIQTLLGEALLNSGNASAAAEAFKRALQIDPDNARARDGYDEASSRIAPPAEEPAEDAP
jgi:eukaryotic-like serine/threonine-protein kinase